MGMNHSLEPGLRNQDIGSKELRSVVVGGLGHGCDVLLVVADSRQQGSHHHAGVDPVFHQVLHRLQPCLGTGRPRLGEFPDLVVHGADAEIHADGGQLAELLQQVDVAADQHALGGDAGGIGEVDQHPEHPPA